MGEFDNLHQILLSLYEEMMPLCSDMAGVAKGLAGLGALFYVAMRVWQSLARAEAIDVYPLLRPVCHRAVHPFLPDRRAGYDEFRAGACRGGHALDAGRTDLRHEQIQGAEGQAGVRGDDAEPGNRLPCFGRGVRPADRRAGLVAVGPGHDDGDVYGLGVLQHQEERA